MVPEVKYVDVLGIQIFIEFLDMYESGLICSKLLICSYMYTFFRRRLFLFEFVCKLAVLDWI